MRSEKGSCALDGESFNAIAELAYRESGLQLVAEKTSMIQSRLRHRLKALGVNDFETYARFVCSEDGKIERRHMISALTTNVSHFFRERHHFQAFAEKILPAYIEGMRHGERLRIWSAGCSNGQEPYSIAISALEAYPEIEDLDFKVLATDIDPKVVSFAANGVYPLRLVSGVPEHILSKYFDTAIENGEHHYRAKNTLRSKIVFKELNLLADWPMKQRMDVIFCRNVVIYFDSKTQNELWPRFRAILAPDGYLFLGHSERISAHESAGFVNEGPTTYRRVAGR